MRTGHLVEIAVIIVGIGAAVASCRMAWDAFGPYGEYFGLDPRIQRVYNPATGTLDVLAVDTDGDWLLDSWSFYEHGRVVRMEFDDDQDGRMDRRRFFAADGTVERTVSLATGPRGQEGQ